MAKILRNWTKLSGADRLTFGQTVKDDLAGNPVLPATDPDYVAYVAAFDPWKAKSDEIAALEEQLRTARLAKTPLTDAWLAATEQLARKVDSVTGGDAAGISTTGFTPTGEGVPAPPSPTPGGAIGQVVNFSVSAGDNDGELDYQHDRVLGAVTYEPQTTTNPNDPASWVSHPSVPQTKGTITGLPSATRLWMRVRGIGRRANGPWSDPATKTVP